MPIPVLGRLQRVKLAFLLFGILSLLEFSQFSQGLVLEGRVSRQSQPVEPGVVGVQFEIRPQVFPVILEVYPGTPAMKAGLRPGDEVIAIDSRKARGLSILEVDQAISDLPGDRVELLINRQGRVFPVALVVESLENIESDSIHYLYSFPGRRR